MSTVLTVLDRMNYKDDKGRFIRFKIDDDSWPANVSLCLASDKGIVGSLNLSYDRHGRYSRGLITDKDFLKQPADILEILLKEIGRTMVHCTSRVRCRSIVGTLESRDWFPPPHSMVYEHVWLRNKCS